MKYAKTNERTKSIREKRAKRLIKLDWESTNWWKKHQPYDFKSFKKNSSIQNNEEGD